MKRGTNSHFVPAVVSECGCSFSFSWWLPEKRNKQRRSNNQIQDLVPDGSSLIYVTESIIGSFSLPSAQHRRVTSFCFRDVLLAYEVLLLNQRALTTVATLWVTRQRWSTSSSSSDRQLQIQSLPPLLYAKPAPSAAVALTAHGTGMNV
jgi:hypothetical protein